MTAIRPWHLLDSRTVLDDRWIRVDAERLQTADGTVLDPFYVYGEHDWAAALPVLPDGRVVMVEQYRRGVDAVCLEFPAGDIDAGEEPVATALRELAEETGYQASDAPRALGALAGEPARNRSRGHGFVVPVAAEAAAQRTDPGETIAVRLCDAAAIQAALAEGRFCHALHVAWWFQARAAAWLP